MTRESASDRHARLALVPVRKSTPTTFDRSALHTLRIKARMSTAQLAAHAGTHLRADVVDLYEAGDRQPSFDRLAQIADALGVTIVELLNRDYATSTHHWYREAAGLSHVDVADKLGVHRSTVSRWDATGEIATQHLQACAGLYATSVKALTANAHERVNLSLSHSLAAQVDRARGKQTRERYLADLIASTFENPS